MNRHARLIVLVAALVGLKAPLCVYACAELGSPEAFASAEHAPADTPPCHGGGAPEAPSHSPASDHDCDCDRLPAVLKAFEGKKVPGPLAVAAALRAGSPVAERLAAAPLLRPRDRHQSLPPPDILLLKTSLLI